MATISGVLAFVKIQEPALKFQSDEKEWVVDVIVDEDTADAWNEEFAKQPAKAIKTAEFESVYKIAPPFPDAKKQYVIKLKKACTYKDGNPLPEWAHPKVLVQDEDGEFVNITHEKLVGNGSIGTVTYDFNENSYGKFARLRNVLVETLIEYEKVGGVDPELAKVVKAKGAKPATSTASTAATAKAAKPATAPVQDLDEDLPF